MNTSLTDRGILKNLDPINYHSLDSKQWLVFCELLFA